LTNQDLSLKLENKKTVFNLYPQSPVRQSGKNLQSIGSLATSTKDLHEPPKPKLQLMTDSPKLIKPKVKAINYFSNLI